MILLEMRQNNEVCSVKGIRRKYFRALQFIKVAFQATFQNNSLSASVNGLTDAV
jgi:hypothetical protein